MFAGSQPGYSYSISPKGTPIAKLCSGGWSPGGNSACNPCPYGTNGTSPATSADFCLPPCTPLTDPCQDACNTAVDDGCGNEISCSCASGLTCSSTTGVGTCTSGSESGPGGCQLDCPPGESCQLQDGFESCAPDGSGCDGMMCAPGEVCRVNNATGMGECLVAGCEPPCEGGRKCVQRSDGVEATCEVVCDPPCTGPKEQCFLVDGYPECNIPGDCSREPCAPGQNCFDDGSGTGMGYCWGQPVCTPACSPANETQCWSDGAGKGVCVKCDPPCNTGAGEVCSFEGWEPVCVPGSTVAGAMSVAALQKPNAGAFKVYRPRRK
jgi:hypothetical protein